MIMGAYHLYFWCAPIVALLAYAKCFDGWQIADRDLFKATSALVFQQVAVSIWDIGFKPDGFQGQASWLFVAINFVAVWIVTRIPAGRGSGLIATILVFGILANGIAGLSKILYGYSAYLDWINWFCILAGGWLNLLILLGWTNADRGRRIAVFIANFFAGSGVAVDKTGASR